MKWCTTARLETGGVHHLLCPPCLGTACSGTSSRCLELLLLDEPRLDPAVRLGPGCGRDPAAPRNRCRDPAPDRLVASDDPFLHADRGSIDSAVHCVPPGRERLRPEPCFFGSPLHDHHRSGPELPDVRLHDLTSLRRSAIAPSCPEPVVATRLTSLARWQFTPPPESDRAARCDCLRHRATSFDVLPAVGRSIWSFGFTYGVLGRRDPGGVSATTSSCDAGVCFRLATARSAVIASRSRSCHRHPSSARRCGSRAGTASRVRQDRPPRGGVHGFGRHDRCRSRGCGRRLR